VRTALAERGPGRTGEKRVTVVFVATAMAWTFQLVLRDAAAGLGLGIPITDDSIAAVAGVLILTVPSGEPGKRYAPLVPLTALRRLPWDVLLLFGGGLTIAACMSEAGVLTWLAGMLAGLSGWPLAAVVLLMVVLAIFVSELLSNVALVTVLAPIACVAGERLGVAPIMMGLAVCFGASLAFMLPIGTPPNAIVYSSGHVSLGTMVKSGFALNVASALVIWLGCLALVPLVFG
jgi:sodium-dependent dicarboxylate transporter 2/3/5